MAKNVSPKSPQPAKIRFVLLEAELPNGDLSQITQALVNALKQSDGTTTNRRLTVSNINNGHANSETDSASLEEEVGEELVDEEAAATIPSRSSSPRKYRTPKVLDMKLDGEPTFETYAQSKQLGSNHKKFLAVAAWFKEVKQVESISVDHVYTCYRFMKWPTNVADFSQPLRDLKANQYLELKAKGLYGITHLGLNHIDKADVE